MAKQFRAPTSQDYTIIEDKKIVGTVRIKPSTIMWKAKSQQVWKGVSVEAFAAFAGKKGKDMKK
jgi:hypothetical protein